MPILEHLHMGFDAFGRTVLPNVTGLPDSPALIPALNGSPLLSHSLLAQRPDGPAGSTFAPTVFRGLTPTTTLVDLPLRLTDVIRRAEGLLITGESLAEVLPLIMEFAKLRKSSPLAQTTALVLSEEQQSPVLDRSLRLLKLMGVTPVKTMVYRLPTVDRCDAEVPGTVADVEVKWLAEGEPTAGVLATLSRHPAVTFVDELAPYATQKRWLVEGPIMALALVARDDLNLPTIRDAAATTAGERWLTGLLRALTAGLKHAGLQLPDSATYGIEQCPAWLRHHDEVSQILQGLRRSDLQWFLIDLNAKIGRPARAAKAANSGSLPDELVIVFDALHNLLLSPQQYEDVAEVQTGAVELTASKDEAAAYRYRLLLDGVLPEAELEARVAEAMRVWASKRHDAGGA